MHARIAIDQLRGKNEGVEFIPDKRWSWQSTTVNPHSELAKQVDPILPSTNPL
jgi:hypothetical protein